MSSSTTKVITPKAMLSYPHLDKPQLPPNGGAGKAKYSCTLVFAPGSDLRALHAAVEAAAEAKYPGKGKDMLAKRILKSPFRDDAEAKGYPEGSIFLNVRTEQAPGVVYLYAGPDNKPAVMPVEKIRDEMYPGAFVRASLVAFAYDSSGNKGVSFALNNVQKLGDGERLDGRVSAENEFEADLNAAPADLAGLM